MTCWQRPLLLEFMRLWVILRPGCTPTKRIIGIIEGELVEVERIKRLRAEAKGCGGAFGSLRGEKIFVDWWEEK